MAGCLWILLNTTYMTFLSSNFFHNIYSNAFLLKSPFFHTLISLSLTLSLSLSLSCKYYALFHEAFLLVKRLHFLPSLDPLQAYTEKKAMVVEEVDTPETYGAAFTVVNKVCCTLNTGKSIFLTLFVLCITAVGERLSSHCQTSPHSEGL